MLAWDNFDKNFYILENSISIEIEDLLFIKKQKQILLENTVLYAQGMPSNNVLLWGARGTGKSSLIFSIFNYIKKKYNIALLEIKRNQLKHINFILRQLNNTDQKVIIFFDDFSFAANSDDFIIFKNILDGSVSRNLNFLFYTTSNFRSLIQHNNKSNMDMIEQ